MKELIEKLLRELGEDPSRKGLQKTPERVEKSFKYLTSGYGINIEQLVNDALYQEDYDEMIIVKDIDIYIPGAVDLEKEKARLIKQRDQLGGRIGGAKKKLANENFLSKARPEVVERERQRLGELEAELEKVEANLGTLD